MTDGTRLTTRARLTSGRAAAAFLAANSASVSDALLAQLVELADLLGDRALRRAVERAVVPAAADAPTAVVLAVLVGLDLPVDLVLHRATGLRMSEKCWRPARPPDSMTRSPAPSIRSKIDWLKNTVLTRSSGISMPFLDSTPCR